MENKLYTKEEVIELLVKERNRSIDIAYDYKINNDKKANSYKKISYNNDTKEYLIHMIRKYEDLANECRMICNSISGENALTTGEPMEEIIKKDYDL